MKIFLVMESTGSYEDYRRTVDKIFLSRECADKYISDQTRYWDEVKKRAQKCRGCSFYWDMDDATDQHSFERLTLGWCDEAEFDWEDKTMPCHEDIWEDQIPTYNIDEREVE